MEDRERDKIFFTLIDWDSGRQKNTNLLKQKTEAAEVTLKSQASSIQYAYWDMCRRPAALETQGKFLQMFQDAPASGHGP